MSVNYADTLNLPKTKFKMKANLPINEPSIILYWQNIDLYNLVKYENDLKRVFIISDGPPYANGSIHLGHALNKILKDIINKFQILNGYKIIYIPGWDCHGLPIELNVEKKVKIKFVNIKDEEFIIACRSYAKYQVEKQKASFIRLGILADWSNIYMTMNNDFESSVINNLSRIIRNNHLYKGEKPVYWCIFCKSALAEAEVEYIDKKSDSIDVIFLVYNLHLIEVCYLSLNNKYFYLGYGNCSFVIWTTTPWTLPANEAVALNYDYIYILVQFFNCRIILAYNLFNAFLQKNNIKFYKLLSKCLGKNFLNKFCLIHPIFNVVIPLVFSNHVTMDIGTGCVHIAPGHGYDDYVIGKKYGLSISSIIDDSGKCLLEDFYGIVVDELSFFIIQLLKNNYILFSSTCLNHSYPHCWRHKKPLIFRSTYQFFISMKKKKLRDLSLQSINDVIWYPSNGVNRIRSMIETRPDWCISRQRIWGIPISIFINISNLKIHPYTSFIFEKISYLISKYGIEIWKNVNIRNILMDDSYFQIFDTLDVWFDSGSVYNYQKLFLSKLFFPADLYLEGSDQHRGWFQTSLLLANANEGKAPYKKILTHGFVLDAFGNKMSKSLGNIITPEKLINDFGADVVRLWVSSTNFQFDVNISLEILNRVIESYRKIRNTIKFLLSNINDFDELNIIPFSSALKLDKWIISCCMKLQIDIIEDYNNYNFHNVYHKIQNFCINELGGFYLDIIKDRQYTCKKFSFIRLSSQTAIFYILKIIIVLISPILSFTSEEAWKYISKEKSVFLSKWFDILNFDIYEKFSFDFWGGMLVIKNLVNNFFENYRKFCLIGSFLELDISLYCNIDLYLLLLKLKNELRFLFISSSSILKLIDDRSINYDFFENFKFYVDIKKSIYTKCDRCWHRVYINQYQTICDRCILNLSIGENRLYL